MRIAMGAALAALLVLAALRLREGRRDRREMPRASDCEVSECGADGVPLSTYAG